MCLAASEFVGTDLYYKATRKSDLSYVWSKPLLHKISVQKRKGKFQIRHNEKAILNQQQKELL